MCETARRISPWPWNKRRSLAVQGKLHRMRNRNPLNVSWRLLMSKRVTLLATAAVLVGLSSGAHAENFFQALFGGGWGGVQEGRSVAVASGSPCDGNVVRREGGPARPGGDGASGEGRGSYT